MAFAQNATARKEFNTENKLAIQGYDPVAYFVQNKAVEGKANISYTHQNIVYRFSSAANLDLFKSNPDKYEPQYGGWCAYAMGAKGEKVEINPKTFKIINGKLFLFYNAFFNNTLESWNEDEQRLHKAADLNWNKIVGK
jgi:YHS domain-containing protein